MRTVFTRGAGNGTADRLDGRTAGAERPEQPALSRIDSNSVRWVFAATVAFWLVVYAAGRGFF